MKRKGNPKQPVKKPRARAARSHRRVFERKPAEAALQDAASQLRAVLHNAPITIFATDSHGVFTLSDGKGLERVGLKPGENVGVSAFDLYSSFPFVEHTGQVTAGKDVIRRALAGETVTAFTELRGAYFENHIGPLRDKDGKVIGIVGVATDITERKRAEESLRESEERYRDLVELSPDMISVHSEGKILYTNPAAAELVGVTRPQELIGRSMFEFVHPDARQSLATRLAEIYRAGEQRKLAEAQFTRLDGKIIDIEVSSTSVNYQGKVARQVIVRDITERKRAQERLVYQGQLLASVHDAIIATDERFTLTEWNRAAERMYGWTAEEAIGRKANEIIPTEFTDAQLTEALRLLRETGHYRVEVVQYRRDGKPIHVEGTTMALRDAKGQISGYVSVNRDITERKRMEATLHESEKRFRALIENASDVVALVSADGTILYESPALTRVLGYVVEERTSRVFFELVHPDDLPDVTHRFAQLLQHPAVTVSAQFRYRHKEGSWHWLEGTGQNLLAEPGVQAIVANYRDVTERKRAEEERARLFEQVRASRERLRHLTQQVVFAQEEERQRISHELHDEAGQALTALKISLGLIQKELPADLTALGQRLNDCITMSEATLERIHLLAQNLRPPGLDAVGLGATLEGFCLDFAKRTQLSIDYVGTDVPALPETVTISFYRFLQDALTNVVKHAHASHVQVVLNVDADTIALSVEDDGQGFDVQSAQVVSGRPKGIGLIGMQERFGSLGGRVEIVSQPGQGTRLVARVPRKEVA